MKAPPRSRRWTSPSAKSWAAAAWRCGTCWTAAADRPAQECAALPLLRLFGLACTDGILRRYTAGPLATHFSALLSVHETLAEARAALFLAECQAPPPDAAFAALCLA